MNLPSELHTDWSAVGLGTVLIQIDSNGKEFVIAYASRSNNRTERNYSSYYAECFAAVWAVLYFRIYLYDGRPFVLKTDHEPLKWLMTSEKLTGMHALGQVFCRNTTWTSNIGRVLLMGTLMGSRGTRYRMRRIGQMHGCIMIVP
jgi:hypothetical protein